MAVLIKESAEVSVVWRLIRCQRTRRYFSGGGWTEDPAKAHDFPDEVAAVRACVEHGLQDVELVLRVPGGRTDLFSTSIR
jgi:hypothetical protein